MSNYAISLRRTTLLLLALAFTAVLTIANLSIFSIGHASAGQLAFRKVELLSTLAGNVGSTTAANSETNGADTTHTFTFDPASTGTIEAIRFDYCQAAIGTCNAPAGLVVNSGTAVTVQTNEGVTFTNAYGIDGTSDANTLNLDSATGNTFTAGTGGTIVFAFDDITNPTTVDDGYFVRITTYDNDDYTGARDTGTVAFAITQGISITSRVVETLGFSTTATDTTTAEGASCSPLGGTGIITLGDVTEGTLSISQAYDAFSAFRLYTNAANGVVVQYKGASLTKGSDVIDAIGATLAASDVGVEQFGLAIDPNGGTYNGDTGGFGGAGQLTLGANYNDGDGTITDGGTASFAFVAGTLTTVASASSYVTCDTASVRYIGNISPLTPAGTYTTTVVYYAVPTY